MSSDPFAKLINALDSLNDPSKYDPFKVITANYKPLGNGTSHIQTDILIPKTLQRMEPASKCPVMLRVHGGFLVTGSSRYPPWFSNWILDYAISKGAVIVSPNYRLLPEASGHEILEDIHDFWEWFHAGKIERVLREHGYSNILPDFGKTLAVGESAGGYLAIQLALSYPSQVRGVIAAYPMLDLQSQFYTKAYSKPIVGVPNLPSRIVSDHIAESSRQPVTAADPPDRLELAFAITQNGLFLDYFGTGDSALFPMQRVQGLTPTEGAQLPRLFIFHGEQDSAVPVDGLRYFIRLLNEKGLEEKVKVHTQNGDHGFDASATLETAWLKDGLEWISGAWLETESETSRP